MSQETVVFVVVVSHLVFFINFSGDRPWENGPQVLC